MYNSLSNGKASVFVMPCSHVETNAHYISGCLICPCTKQIFHSGHVQILLLDDLFIRSTWTYFASIVTCSWNGLEQYWIGICVSHSWDLGNWGSLPATVFQFDSINDSLFSMTFPKKSHSNFSLMSLVHTKAQRLFPSILMSGGIRSQNGFS